MENLISHKICTKCGVNQPLDNFYKVKRTKPKVRNYPYDGYKAMCKGCYKKRAADWAAKNPDKRKEIARRWDAENFEKRKDAINKYNKLPETKARHKEWRKNNVVSYSRNRRQTDTMYALKIKIRGLLKKAFDRNGYTKRSKSNEILGCDWDFFKKHLENQFLKGMTWENRSEWHIDHIIPISSAKTEEDVIKLNHYTNLRPLWAADNLRKSNKLETLL